MTTIYAVLLTMFILPKVQGAGPILIEDFKKITNGDKRQEIIDKAPIDRKDQLERMDIHLRLLGFYGGEAALKKQKETYVGKARGFEDLEDVFIQHQSIWDIYIGGIGIANEKAGMTPDKRAEAERHLMEEEGAIRKRIDVVHLLVFNMAASPQALELEKKAERLDDELRKRITTDGSTVFQPITTEERIKADKQVDQIFEEMKKMPTLTREQVQKEYDEFPEEKIPGELL